MLKVAMFLILFVGTFADEPSTEQQPEITTTENPVLAQLGQFRSDLRTSFDAAKNNGHEGLQKFLDHLAEQKMEIDQQHEKFRQEIQQVDNAKSRAKEMTKYLNQLRRELSEESKSWSQEAHNKTNELWDSVRQYEKLVQQSIRKGKQGEHRNHTGEHLGNEKHEADRNETERHDEGQETTTQSQQSDQEQQFDQERNLNIPQQEHHQERLRRDQQDEAQTHQQQHGDHLDQQQQQPQQQQHPPIPPFPEHLENANVHSSSVRGQHADDRLNQPMPTIAVQPILI